MAIKIMKKSDDDQNPPIKKAVTDSIDDAKAKAIQFAKKNFSRKDFVEKDSPELRDSIDKYRNIVFDAARTLSKKDMMKKGISREITKNGDTITKYRSGNIEMSRTNPKR